MLLAHEPPKRDPVRYRKILCPVDFSESSRAALDTAVALARSQDGPLTLLHIYNLPMNLPDGYFDPEIFQIIGTATDKLLAEWKLLAEASGAAHVDTASMPGTAWNGVVATARQGRYALIVLGTHGRTGLNMSCSARSRSAWSSMRRAGAGGPADDMVSGPEVPSSLLNTVPESKIRRRWRRRARTDRGG